jgi:hypothetical protein
VIGRPLNARFTHRWLERENHWVERLVGAWRGAMEWVGMILHLHA